MVHGVEQIVEPVDSLKGVIEQIQHGQIFKVPDELQPLVKQSVFAKANRREELVRRIRLLLLAPTSEREAADLEIALLELIGQNEEM